MYTGMSLHQHHLADHMDMSIDADELTEAVAIPIAFHRLPVAAYTGAATITPCSTELMVDGHTGTCCPHEVCCTRYQYLLACMLPVEALCVYRHIAMNIFPVLREHFLYICTGCSGTKPSQHAAHEDMEDAQSMHKCMPVQASTSKHSVGQRQYLRDIVHSYG